MSIKRNLAIMAAVIGLSTVVSGAPAQASPVLGGSGVNDIYFNNIENWVDVDGSGTVSAGDQFYGILHVQNIDNQYSGTVWNEDNVLAGGIDTLTGYFLNTVSAAYLEGLTYHITMGTSTYDPNGVISAAELASGVVMKLYSDSSLTRYSDDGPVATDIANSTDGSLWATLTTLGGYWYTHAPISPPTNLGEAIGDSWFGLNFVTNNTGYTFSYTDDPLESESGSPLVQMYGTSNLNVNTAAGSPWMFTSNDPSVVVTPEPGTFLLLGGGLLGLGMYVRRRVRK